MATTWVRVWEDVLPPVCATLATGCCHPQQPRSQHHQVLKLTTQRPRKTKRCELCAEAFEPTLTTRQRFCSRLCSDRFYAAERLAAVRLFRGLGLKPKCPRGKE